MDDALDVLAALADAERLSVVAALVLGASLTDDVAEAASVPKRRALEGLTRLEAAGLVVHEKAGWTFDVYWRTGGTVEL